MSNYLYVAKDKNARTVSGSFEANTESEVVEELHKRGLIVVSVKTTVIKQAFGLRGASIKQDDLVVFSRQLATMIDAGIPLVQSLSILSEQAENPNLLRVIRDIQANIEAGMSFSDALMRHPKVFSELFVNMAKAGEASGMLDDILDRLALYLEKAAALTRKVRSSLVYPAVVVIMSILITAFLLLKVVPTFKGIFSVLGGTLPLPTVILISVSDMLQKNILILLGIIIAIAFIFKRYIRTEQGRKSFDRFILNLPVLGILFRKVAVARFARTFSTLVKSGVSVLNALDIVAKTSGNKVIEEAVQNSRSSVRSGEPISKPLSEGKVFPSMVCRMVGIGEQTGQLEKMLSKIADFYDDQVDTAVAALTSIIEPLVIAFLGIVIGGIVVSLFMPIFKISELLAK